MSTLRPPTNYRKTRRDRDRALFGLVLFFLVVIGSGLIWLIWGTQAAITGGICLFGGGLFLVVLWVLLSLMQKGLDKLNE